MNTTQKLYVKAHKLTVEAFEQYMNTHKQG